jgi:3-oxoacyl-[acyl-carrier-protein] synthase-3
VSARIAGVGASVPAVRVTAERLASGALTAVQLRDEVGFEARYQPERDISPWHLLTEASRDAVRDARIPAGDLDLLLTCGRGRMEYLNWATALSVARPLGADKAIVLDMGDFTGGTLLGGLRVLKARFAADDRPSLALLACFQRVSDMLDGAQPKDRLLWPLGDGGAALVVRREGPGLELQGHAFAHEGRAARQLGVRYETIDEGPNPGSFFDHQWAQAKYYTLRDPARFLADVKERAARRLPEVVRLAVERSGLTLDHVARVQAGFLYPEVHEAVEAQLGLGRRFQRHNAHGMLAGTELGFALRALREDATLKGKHVVLCHAGLPADFGAMVVRL